MTLDHELDAALQTHLSAGGRPDQGAFGALVARLKEAVAAGRVDEAATATRRAVLPTLDYTSAQSLYRIYKRIARHDARSKTARPSLAVLSSFTSKQLVELIELDLFAAGVEPDIYESDYGVFRQEILDPNSRLYEVRPKTVFLATSWRDLAHVPSLGDDREEVDRRLRRELDDIRTLWDTLHDRLGCRILQNNFELPPWRLLDNHDVRHPAGPARYVARLNRMLADEAPPFVLIHDVDHLAATAGRWAFSDERFFHHAKLPCSPECLVDYAHNVASILLAELGLSKKCLVLDLDNTLWGGVIGDDGLGGIRLGQGDAEGEAFLSFQRYVRGLQRRGVILAVCSKNEQHVAEDAFREHPEMVLRLDDISCFIANWTDKATNLRTIAQRLNIGLNSLVLVDDNPAERALVRQLAPEVAVPEMPEDPAGYVQALQSHRYFQMVALGDEDLQRTDYYRANAERRQAQGSSGNLDEFLRSLNMTARVEPIRPATLQRTAQLINKSNQFNLTTRRCDPARLTAMVADPQWITRTVALADRFGDNGLISVLLAHVDGKTLSIDTWLMSCRVLKRDVEHFLLNHLVDVARSLGLTRLRGQYIPTPRNVIVRDHYARLGFEQVQADTDGNTSWELAISDEWRPLPCFIEEERASRRKAA
ncbi:MAG: HAD-IIIC family phosphatase [Thermoguttaceae bacterium]